MLGQTMLEVNGLTVSFRMYDKGLSQKELEVISNLNISVKEGEILAVAGSSGSGKSLLAHAVLGILPNNATISGEMRYMGEPLTPKLQEKLRGKEMALVPQSVEYLDPLMRTGKQVRGINGDKEKQRNIFEKFGLSSLAEKMFPFQLSGGMARRVLISTAVIGDAKLVIADEPTPGLSPELAKTAMEHFRALADQGCGVLLITHDIELALSYADRIAVFYGGTTVETATVHDFTHGMDALRHPYTKALWQAIPQNGFRAIEGRQPYPDSLPGCCLFSPHCSIKTECCAERPVTRELRGGEVCCIHAT